MDKFDIRVILDQHTYNTKYKTNIYERLILNKFWVYNFIVRVTFS